MKTYVRVGANIRNNGFQDLIENIDEKVQVILIELNYKLRRHYE